MANDYRPSNELVNGIAAKIENADTDIKAVYKSDRSSFPKGYPSVTITPADSRALYESNSTDREIYAFEIKIYYAYDDDDDLETAAAYLRDAMDDLRNIFRERESLNEAGADWVQPVPWRSAYLDAGGNHYRFYTLALRCTVMRTL